MRSLPKPYIDFRGALDGLISRVREQGLVPEAIATPPRWREYLAKAIEADSGSRIEPLYYRELPVRTALNEQSSVAVIADDHAHLL